MEITVQPAILEKDVQSIQQRIDAVNGIVEEVQLDVMDGEFVPNTTLNDPEAIAALNWKDLKIALHLMIANPMFYLKKWDIEPVDSIYFHYEAAQNIDECINLIRKIEKKPGIAINPHTPTYDIKDYLDKLDYVMIMGVEPGFSAQAFNADVLEKIKYLRELKPDMPIAVDGGVNGSTKDMLLEAGATIMCSNSYIFGASDVAEAVESLKTKSS